MALSLTVPTNREINGRDLRAERERRSLSAAAVAEAMGVSRPRITAIEHYVAVGPDLIDRYMRAVDSAVEARIAVIRAAVG
jgi:transcriptional regulator with XRE-family HTH domain